MSDGTRTKGPRRRPGNSVRYRPGAVILPDARGKAGTLAASGGLPAWVVPEFRAIIRAMMANRAGLDDLAAAGVVELVPEGTRVRIRSQMGHGAGVEILFSQRRMIPTKAAREVGYSWPDKSGPRLMQHPEIRAAVDAERARRSAELDREIAERRAQFLSSLAYPRRRRRRSRM